MRRAKRSGRKFPIAQSLEDRNPSGIRKTLKDRTLEASERVVRPIPSATIRGYPARSSPVRTIFIDGVDRVCLKACALQDFGLFPVLSCLDLYRTAELDHLPNGAGKTSLCRPEHVSLMLERADERSSDDPDAGLRIQVGNDPGNIQVMDLGKFPRPEFVIGVVCSAMMRYAQR